MLRTLIAAALLTLNIASAHADDASTQVAYSDLDLSQPTDAKTLAARLQDAATSVCLKANPENISPVALENCINVSVHIAMSRIQSDMDSTVRDKLGNVRA